MRLTRLNSAAGCARDGSSREAIRTWAPFSMSNSTSGLPINPVPPVTSTCLSRNIVHLWKCILRKGKNCELRSNTQHDNGIAIFNRVEYKIKKVKMKTKNKGKIKSRFVLISVCWFFEFFILNFLFSERPFKTFLPRIKSFTR